jgi:aconitate hydratase
MDSRLYRKPLKNTALMYYDTQAAVNSIKADAYRTLSYSARVLAENLVRRCDPAILADCLRQIIDHKR